MCLSRLRASLSRDRINEFQFPFHPGIHFRAASPNPTYEALRDDLSPGVWVTLDVLGLRWKPFGLLNESIYVLDDVTDPNSSLQTYQTEAADADSEPIFHAISALPLTDPPVSPFTVWPEIFEYWAADWD